MLDIKYILGDIHLGHNKLYQAVYSEKYDTMEEYENWLIKNYNKTVVDKNSIVLFLGDLGFKEGIDRVLPQLKGKKILIKGNHDKYSKSYYEQYFDKVYDHPLYYNKRIVFSHEPIMVEDGVLNVHGHTHKIKLKSNNHYNACVEWNDYSPIKIKHFTNILSNMSKPDKRFLNEWYKDIYDDYRNKTAWEKLREDIKGDK